MAGDISEDLRFILYGDWDEESISLLNKFFAFYWYEWHTPNDKITEDGLFSIAKKEATWSLNGVNNQFSWINPIELTESDDDVEGDYVAVKPKAAKYDINDWSKLVSIMEEKELIIGFDEILSDQEGYEVITEAEEDLINEEIDRFLMIGCENKILIREL